MSSSHAKVIAADPGNVTHVGITDVSTSESAEVGSAEATDMTASEAADMATTEAAHVAATKTASMSAAASAAAGLRARGSEAAGKQRGCQNHHPSRSHDLSPLDWAGIPPQDFHQTPARPDKANADVAMDSNMVILVRGPH
jgi:hypothetical protein